MTDNIDKIVYVILLDKEGKAHHKHYYLLSEFEDGQQRIADIGGILVSLVPFDTPVIEPLLTAEIDDDVMIGSVVGHVEDITTEDEMIERQAERYANAGVDIMSAQIDNGPQLTFSKPHY